MDREKMNTMAERLIELLPLLHGTVINLDDFNTDSELGRSHYEILAFLQAAEQESAVKAPPMSLVCKKLNISKPYMTNLTDRLINKGYVERIPDPDDRRLIRIKLTDAGSALISEHFGLMRNSVLESLKYIEAQELEGFLSALQNVTATLNKVKGKLREENN